VAFEISLYPPEPPMILKPAQGEIVSSAIVEVAGKALPEELVSVFIDDAFSGSGFADAMGNFSIPSVFEVNGGEHWARAHAMDGFGRMSVFSEAVTFSVFAVPPESPIIGESGRLSITAISDGPDPFYPSLDTTVFHVDALMQAVEGLQGRSPSLTFSSTCSLSIRNAESGEMIRTLDGSVDITGAPVTGGKIAIEQDLAWDGKDESGAFVPAGEIFVYDLDMSTLKIHDNPAARCGRAPCVLDEVHVPNIGTVSTTPLPRPVHRILLVSNMTYPQEQAILEHFQVINAAGDGEFFSVQVLPDYKITGNLDLGSAHAVVLTEFSPDIPADGLLRLSNSEKPMLIVEHEKYNLSQYFNLVTSPDSVPVEMESIKVATNEHPATYYLGEDEKVFAGPQTAFAVPPSAMPQEIMPLMLDPSSGNVITLVDNEKAILATGLSDTTHFSAKGWVLFDLFLNFLHPTARPWDQDPGAAVDALMGPGIMGFLSDVGKNPLNWTYDSALERIWPYMVRQDLGFFLPDMDELIPRMLDLSYGWRFEIYRSPIYGTTRAVLYHRTIEGVDYETDCKAWYDSLTGAAQYLPNNIMYDSTQAGVIPLINFTALDGTHMFLETLSPAINDRYRGVQLRSFDASGQERAVPRPRAVRIGRRICLVLVGPKEQLPGPQGGQQGTLFAQGLGLV
jgi:hypothetical protein